MKLLFSTLMVVLTSATATGVAQASEPEAFCYVPPQTVGFGDRSVSTPSVTIPCP